MGSVARCEHRPPSIALGSCGVAGVHSGHVRVVWSTTPVQDIDMHAGGILRIDCQPRCVEYRVGGVACET